MSRIILGKRGVDMVSAELKRIASQLRCASAEMIASRFGLPA
jgi:hypothetical protein